MDEDGAARKLDCPEMRSKLRVFGILSLFRGMGVAANGPPCGPQFVMSTLRTTTASVRTNASSWILYTA